MISGRADVASSRDIALALLALFASGCEQSCLKSACDGGDGAACAALAEAVDPSAHPPGDPAK